VTTIDSQRFFAPTRDPRDATSTLRTLEADGQSRHDTPGSRAMRAALARAFPVRISSLREALVNGSITKLARP
jgi:hypothetical protein